MVNFDTVMIVDDTPANLSLLSEMLGSAGYRVLVAVDGRSAIQQLDLAKPDIILLDAVMPGLDGFQTCRFIKNSSAHSDVPIIFMTALNDTKALLRGFSEGAEDYVTKPINEQEILARISTHLDRARKAARAQSAVNVLVKAGLTVTASGEITWKTCLAAQWLAYYFPAHDLDEGRLPRELEAWLDNFAESVTQASAPAREYRTGRGGRNLIVRYGSVVYDREILLVMKEQNETSPNMLRVQFNLTPRESDVLYWLAYGKTNKDIGQILGMSPRTVNKHLEHIFIKLNVETRTAAASKAVKQIDATAA